MTKGQVDGGPYPAQLHIRWHERLTTSDSGAHGFSEAWMKQSGDVLCRPFCAYDGGFAVAEGRRAEGGHGLCRQFRPQRFTYSKSWVRSS